MGAAFWERFTSGGLVLTKIPGFQLVNISCFLVAGAAGGDGGAEGPK